MKNKKSICVLLCFTLFVFTLQKPKEADAFDFVVTPTVLWALGTLVLGTGIVAVSNTQILDMGQKVFDDLKLRGYSEEDLLTGGTEALALGIKVNTFVKDSVSKVSDLISLYKEDVVLTKPLAFTNKISLPVSGFPTVKSFGYEDILTNGSKLLTLNFTSSGYVSSTGSGRFSEKYADVGGILTYVGYSIYGMQSILAIYKSPVGVISSFGGADNPDVFNSTIVTSVEYNLTGYWDIPYATNPSISKEYDKERLPVALPYTDSKPGYLPVPNVIPSDDSISTDLPLSWDNVKDSVTDFPIDSTVDTPTDTPSEGTGIWDWLKSLLNSILGILSAILDFLFSLVSSLVTALSDLLTYLFSPTLSVDIFKSPSGGFGKILDVFDFSKLFNIKPQPFKFTKLLTFDYIVDKWEYLLNIDFGEIAFLKDNMTLVRNLISYPLLMGNIYFIVMHLLPRREVD